MKTLFAFCDLNFCPASFDFVTWLVRAMKVKDERKCEHLHVVFVPNDTDEHGGAFRRWGKHDAAATAWRFWHICVASLPLACATMTLAPDRHHAVDLKKSVDAGETLSSLDTWWPEGKAHFLKPLVEAARGGETIPKLQATEAARRHVGDWLARFKPDKRVVTLTVREQSTDPDRNSNLHAWGQFQTWLEMRGFQTIWLDDTNRALSRGRGYVELDPDLRLALYEQAAMNLIGNNGPQELLKFSASPYMAFGQALSEGWKDHFRKHFSMEPGDQLPWAKPDQRLIYRTDSLETLKEEFLKWA